MKLSASSSQSNVDKVRLELGAGDPTLLEIRCDSGYNRAVAHFTRAQAYALAYKLIHAANGGEVVDDVAPNSTEVAA